MFAHIIKVFIL